MKNKWRLRNGFCLYAIEVHDHRNEHDGAYHDNAHEHFHELEYVYRHGHGNGPATVEGYLSGAAETAVSAALSVAPA